MYRGSDRLQHLFVSIQTDAKHVTVTDTRPTPGAPRSRHQCFARDHVQIALRGFPCPRKVDHLDRLVVLFPSAPLLAHVDYPTRQRGGTSEEGGTGDASCRGARCCPAALRELFFTLSVALPSKRNLLSKASCHISYTSVVFRMLIR